MKVAFSKRNSVFPMPEKNYIQRKFELLGIFIGDIWLSCWSLWNTSVKYSNLELGVLI